MKEIKRTIKVADKQYLIRIVIEAPKPIDELIAKALIKR